MSKKNTSFIWYSYLFLHIAGSALLLCLSRIQFVTLIITFLQIPDKAIQLQTRLLTPERWILLWYFAAVWVVIHALLVIYTRAVLLWLCIKWVAFSLSFGYLRLQIAGVRRTLTLSQKRLFYFVLGICFLPKIYQAFAFPFLIDELFTYIYLVQKGIFVAVSYYPGPNNHVFFSLLGTFVDFWAWLFGFEPVVSLRFLSLSVLFFTSWVAFLWLVARFGFTWAIGGILFFNFLPPVFLYSFLARGYALQACFVVFSSIALLELSRRDVRNATALEAIFILSCVLGFYTIPTFLYIMGALAIRYIRLVKPIRSLFLIGIITLLLYLPIILFNGLAAVTRNSWVRALTWQEFIGKSGGYSDLVSADWWGDLPFATGLSMGIILIFLLVFIFKKHESFEKNTFWLILAFFIFPILVLPIQRVLPFVRVWTYMSWIWVLVILLIFKKLPKNKFIFSIFLLVAILFSVWSISRFQWQYQVLPYTQIAQKVRKQALESVFVNDDTYHIFLRYEFLKWRQAVKIEYSHFHPEKQYDLLIFAPRNMPKGTAFLKNYQTITSDGTLRIFQKKSKPAF